jgi:hypothetical protein
MGNVPGMSAIFERWKSLARDQKISAGILGVCGIIAFVLSVERIGASINDPFTISKSTFESSKAALDGLDTAQRDEDAARRRDTDGDGLSDYDEETFFQTSPYLRDTDGDGSPDNAELALGQNPNCGPGGACVTGAIDVSGLASSSAPFLFTNGGNNSADEFLASFQRGINTSKASISGTTGSTSTDLEPTLVRDADEIRKALRESGEIDEEDLARITDAQLLQLYDDAVAQAANNEAEVQRNSVSSTN